MTSYAKVRIPSPLPQLDKEFDYAVPENLSIQFGSLVKVPFGKKAVLKIGVVVGLSDTSEYEASAAVIHSVIGKHALLTPEQYSLAQEMAERFAGSISEILHSMLPTFSSRIDAKYEAKEQKLHANAKSSIVLSQGDRIYLQPRLISEAGLPDWADQFVLAAASFIARGESVLVVLPDYRDLATFETALTKHSLDKFGIRHSSSDKNSERYFNHLEATNQVGIVYGLRSTVLSPAKKLGLILVLDDGDESHFEQSSPYWNSRDVALLRQSITGSALVFCSHSPSADVVRLIELGFLKHVKTEGAKPVCRVSENPNRLDDENYALVARTLSSGRAVLVQVANLGFASSIACRKCNERRVCVDCGTGIWIDTAGNYRCRGCKKSGQLPDCSCGGNQVKTIRIGSSSMAEWLAKAFPTAKVVHSSGEERLLSVEPGNTLVISTPGSEPDVEGGYSAVILADAGSMLGFPALRALEQSTLKWANAAAKLSKDGIVVFVGLKDELANQARHLDFFAMVSADFEDRKELALPPVTRLASVTSVGKKELNNFVAAFRSQVSFPIREITTTKPDVFAFCYEYGNGKEIAGILKNISQEVSAKSKDKKPGQRLFRIAMDDWQVI